MTDTVYVPVDTNRDLVRDMRTKAILNVNSESFNSYKKNRDKAREIDRVVAGYDEMQSEITEIKKLLQRLLDKSL